MLTKEKALAIADTITAPAEAERSRKVEARTGVLTRLHPGLKRVPAEKRSSLLRDAQHYASRHWSFILVAALMVLAIASPFIARAVGGWFPFVQLRPPFMALPTLGVLVLNQYLVRRYLKAEIPTRFPAANIPTGIAVAQQLHAASRDT